MNNNFGLRKAKYSEWTASLLGACGIALGLGSLLSDYIQPVAKILILLGVILHAWGMYKIQQRNK
jgi:hypothetical protein